MAMKFKDVAKILGYKASDKEKQLVITGFSTDTRTLKKGDLFIAIKGENFDGGDFVKQALEKGAVGAITDKNLNIEGVIKVEDPIKALGSIALAHRDSFEIPVIAVTGSSGKTTVKDMIVQLLSVNWDVHYTEGNLNNHIGMPMTLLKTKRKHKVCVVEMGMNSRGEIDYLSKIAKPEFGVITNIGTAHIGELGSQEQIFKAKTELIANIKTGGYLFINGDDEYLSKLSNLEDINTIKFGIGNKNDVQAEKIRKTGAEFYEFIYGKTLFKLNVPGKHNIYNALAAISVAKNLGMDIKEIKQQIEKYLGSEMRLNIKLIGAIRVIDDSYNANPESMKAALNVLETYKGRRIAVLGDMLELGCFSDKNHFDIGVEAAQKADLLLFCGKQAQNYKKGALSRGKNEKHIYTFKYSDQAGQFIADIAQKGDTVLLKGSRGMKMENVLEYFKGEGDRR